MKTPKVNLLSGGERNVTTQDRTGQRPVRFFLSPMLVGIIFLTSFGFGRLTRSETAAFALEALQDIPILGQMRHLVRSPDRKLRGEENDRVNILLLGMGGEGHEGPNLTDTIMVASIRPTTNTVALLSVPRDLIVPLPKVGWRKINSANAFGELEKHGRGAEYTRTVLEGLLGLEIPYYVRVDFQGFKELIDSVDGVDIYVEKNFTDYTYPTKNFGVQAVSFKQGWQHLDGDTALKFARSRHGTNGEGSDFARAKRQQKVMSALKDKVLSVKTVRNPSTVSNMLAALQSNISTNFQIGEILRLARMAQHVDREDLVHKVIDNSPGSPVVDGHFGGAYVLVPRNDDWGGLRTVAETIFTEAKPDAAPPPPPPPDQSATVEIRNGSGKSGAARTVSTSLNKAGFKIVRIGNADSFDYEKSVIYDLTKGQKDEALAKLKQTTGADAKKAPSSLKAEGAIDFILIIGKNDAE